MPLDMNTLKALKRSSLGLDLYLWGTYRTFTLTRPLRLSWRQVYLQFGADPARADDNVTVQNLRRKVLRELKEDQTGLARPELHNSPWCFDPASLGPRHSTFGSSSASKLGGTTRL